ncbi:MAG TPA: hypothetical protein VF796_17135 [Humisphaera sp.]
MSHRLLVAVVLGIVSFPASGCCPKPNVLDTNPLAVTVAPDVPSNRRRDNWFRSWRSDTGVWVRAANAGGPKDWPGHSVRAELERYMRATGRAEMVPVSLHNHAHLWVAEYRYPPPPVGFGRVGSGYWVLWYDDRVARVVAETADE